MSERPLYLLRVFHHPRHGRIVAPGTPLYVHYACLPGVDTLIGRRPLLSPGR